MVAEPIAQLPARDPGSFRDPSGGVYHLDGRILRYLNGPGAADFRALRESGLLETLIERGDLVGTTALEPGEVPAPAEFAPTLVLEHERIPFISYPYEWPFELLQSAALQYLRVLRTSLDHGFIVKDATPYNTQFAGTRPSMIDVSSFEAYVPGQPWAAYSQFCRLFLNPLLLQSRVGLPYQRWLRSSIDGITPDELCAVLPFRSKLRRSVFMHVVLQSWMGRKLADDAKAVQRAASQELAPKTLRRLVDQLEGMVAGLRRPTDASVWADYELDCHYDPRATAAKDRFVDEVLADWRPGSAWDLGCNRGRYSAIAARHAGGVVAMDGDELAVGGLALRDDVPADRVLPLVMDLSNPSPDQGWAGSERQGLDARGPADAALALALIHHLSIAGHVPLPSVVDWLAACARRVIVEFVPPEDPMAQRLLATRFDEPADYHQAAFEHAVERCFRVVRTEQIEQSSRTLYALERR